MFIASKTTDIVHKGPHRRCGNNPAPGIVLSSSTDRSPLRGTALAPLRVHAGVEERRVYPSRLIKREAKDLAFRGDSNSTP
jgi:hypothetical protein